MDLSRRIGIGGGGIRRVLIANRGEVAIRVVRACKAMAIESVAVYSSIDSLSPHVAAADMAFALPGHRPDDTYLSMTALLEAARRTGADAIHPGYGFLAESAEFAQAVADAGLIFVGPDPRTIAEMGSKSTARARVKALGVPVIPGESPSDQSDSGLVAAAHSVGWPLLLKASAGGGGMGMRIVRSEDELLAAIHSVRHEALSAFGSDHMILERFVERVHHIEIQVISDGLGGHWHAFDRECSVQRRRQKVIEEAPSPNVDADLRVTLCDAALRIAKAVDYRGLGTVEFIVDPTEGAYYFLEMNTRLQVEHAITEAVTGLDLVQLQLAIASGAGIRLDQSAIELGGHAIECRWYAEDPAQQFAPTGGSIRCWQPRPAPGARVEHALAAGMEVSSQYDPMMAKVIGAGETREDAIRAVDYTLGQSTLLGVDSNQGFLRKVLADEQFRRGDTNTTFLEERSDLQRSDDASMPEALISALAFWEFSESQELLRKQGRDNAEYFYSVGSAVQCVSVAWVDGYPGVGSNDDRVAITLNERSVPVRRLSIDSSGAWLVEVDGIARWYEFAREHDHRSVGAIGDRCLNLTQRRAAEALDTDRHAGDYRATMPGRVISVAVEVGDTVATGQRLLTLESMKMEHAVVANAAGCVTQIDARVDQTVAKGERLIAIAGG